MKSNWLKFGSAALISAAVFVAPGCGGGGSNDNDDDDTIGNAVPGVLTPTDGPVGTSFDTLEECSGLDLSEAQQLLGLETDLANSVNNGLLGFATGDGSIDELLALGNFLGGDGVDTGNLSQILDQIGPVLDDLSDAGVIGANASLTGDTGAGDAGGAVSVTQTDADIDAINALVETIQQQITDGLPGGSDQLVSDLTELGGLLEALPVNGTGADAIAADRVLDSIGGVLSNDAALLEAVSNLDVEGVEAAFDGILENIEPLQTACDGVSTGVLDDPLATVAGTLEGSDLPIIGQLFPALAGNLGTTDPATVLTSLISGDFTSVAGVDGLEALLSGGPLSVLRGNLGLLGDLLGPLAGIDDGGLLALTQLTDPESTLPSITELFNQIPGLETISAGQAGGLIGTLLTPVDGVAPIASGDLLGLLSGGDVLGNIGDIGGLLGGLLGGLGGLNVGGEVSGGTGG